MKKPLDNLTAPIYYDHANAALTQQQPGTIHCSDNTLSQFFKRYFIQRIFSVYDFKLPETWATNYFLYTLFVNGYIAIINTDKFGVIPQDCGLMGYNVMYQPTNAVIANPLLRGNLTPRIGTQCAILRLQPDYGGVYDLVSYYANLMACAAQGATTNFINSKFSYVFFAENRAQAETFKALFDNMSSGQPASAVDKNLLDENGNPKWQLFTQNVGQNFIADKILSSMIKVSEMFDTEIGIPNANEEKRERLVVSEVNANNIETFAKATLWLEELKKGCEQANKLFGINMGVDFRKYDLITEVIGAPEPNMPMNGGNNNASDG